MANKIIQLTDGTDLLFPKLPSTNLTSTDNIDNYSKTIVAWCNNIQNKPDSATYGYLVVNSSNDNGSAIQRYYVYEAAGVSRFYVRTRINNTWQPWRAYYSHYRTGDTFTLSAYVVLAGHVTSGCTSLQFTLPLSRDMDSSITKFTVSKISGSVRIATGGYLISGKSGSTFSFADGDYDSISAIVCKSPACIRFSVTCNSYYKKDASTNVPNNSVVSIALNEFSGTFS